MNEELPYDKKQIRKRNKKHKKRQHKWKKEVNKNLFEEVEVKSRAKNDLFFKNVMIK